MKPSYVQLRTRIEQANQMVKSPNIKSQTNSKRLKFQKFSDIETIGNKFKGGNQDNNFKYRRLNYLFQKLDVDITSLIETQISHTILNSSFHPAKAFLKRIPFKIVFSHNNNEGINA